MEQENEAQVKVFHRETQKSSTSQRSLVDMNDDNIKVLLEFIAKNSLANANLRCLSKFKGGNYNVLLVDYAPTWFTFD